MLRFGKRRKTRLTRFGFDIEPLTPKQKETMETSKIIEENKKLINMYVTSGKLKPLNNDLYNDKLKDVLAGKYTLVYIKAPPNKKNTEVLHRSDPKYHIPGLEYRQGNKLGYYWSENNDLFSTMATDYIDSWTCQIK